MFSERRNWLAIGSVVLLGALALLQHWLADRRPAPTQSRAAHEFVVTSSEDKGPGSLREAILAADTAEGRARIVFLIKRVVLRTPLPPLVNMRGIAIEAPEEGAEIDARGLDVGPVLDVDARNSSIVGIAIRNAPQQAILVRADGFQLRSATVERSDEGLYVADGIKNVVVEGTRFANNRIGVRLVSSDAGIVLRGNRFVGHREAAVWAVRREFDSRSARKVMVLDNHFQDDRISLVLGNAPVVVVHNEFSRQHEAALFLVGQGVVVRENRIRNGAGSGIIVDGVQGAVIEANELDRNSALAILVRGSRNTLVQGNRIHNNGYGIAFVLGDSSSPTVARQNLLLSQRYDGITVIGDAPVIGHNQVRNSRLAAIRLLDFFPLKGAKIEAQPFLEGNVWAGNALNEPVRGEYRQTKRETSE